MSFALMMTLFITLAVSAVIIVLYECRLAPLRSTHAEKLRIYEDQLNYYAQTKNRMHETIIAYCDKRFEEYMNETPSEATDDR